MFAKLRAGLMKDLITARATLLRTVRSMRRIT
jgi:hypothetical protein